MENNFNIQRDGFKLNNNSFERRNSFELNNNFNQNRNVNQNVYRSLDGRTWQSKSDEFAANKKYYQEMLDKSRVNK